MCFYEKVNCIFFTKLDYNSLIKWMIKIGSEQNVCRISDDTFKGSFLIEGFCTYIPISLFSLVLKGPNNMCAVV